uniref:Uncharacterized protein LOC111105545 isoform X3 n=1 Tax=Crassostrea virginica TaxID=6565 RepID=A0A8B8AXY6_CRAVI|nr:uncharacterized protein LOC111105545 isoform X3 [Crassostrea virginica]
MKCPASYFGENCASECNCDVEKCHYVYGCKPLQAKSITSTISRGPRMTEKSTSLVVTHSQTLKDENGSPQYQKGGKNCTNKKKHRIFPTTVVSVMIASFATIFGLFLIFYLGLHYCVKKQNPNRAVF